MNNVLRGMCGTILLGLIGLPARGDAPTRSEIAKLGKAATALVEAGNNSQGSAFCIHPAGFFITNQHVVQQNSVLSLVINPGQKTQRILQARVVRADANLDLALLQVSGEKNLPALALGTDDNLTELAEVVALGYPFGTGLALSKQEKPAISINMGSITSLRQKAGELHRIQLDAVLNPGNSGGPVLDKDGKVVGVVVSGLAGAGVNFAIPVSHLSKFIARPEIVFEPPTIRLAQAHEPMEFQARAVALVPSNNKAFDLEFYLSVEGKRARKFQMELKDGVHRVRAEPVPKPAGPAVLRLTAVFEQGTVSGQVTDRTVKAAGADQKLSELRRLWANKNRAILHDGNVLRGELKNLDAVTVDLGPASVTLDLTKAKEVRLERPSGLAGLTCTIVAFQNDKEIGRLTRPLTIQGLPLPEEGSIDLEIEPPLMAKDKEVRDMLAPIQDLAVAGGGRYLILHLPKIGKLAVFDVNEAKVVTMLPAPEDNLKFAGGLDTLVVALPAAKTLQRWDLNTFALDMAVPLDIVGEIMSMSMGSASQGPIVASYKEGNFPLTKFCHWTLDKLERRGVTLEGHFHYQPAFAHVRSSADGKTVGVWYSETGFSGVGWIKWDGQVGKVNYEHNSRGHVIPGPNNKVVFTGSGMFTGLSLAPNQQAAFPGSDPQGRYLPAAHGDYYMHLGRFVQPNVVDPNRALTIYKRGLALPVLKRPDIDIPPTDPPFNFFMKGGPKGIGPKALAPQMDPRVTRNNDFTFDKRLLLIPQAKLLITIPTSNDQLVLHRIDLAAALEKAGGQAALQAADPLPAGETDLQLRNGLASVQGQLAPSDPKDTVMAASHRKIYLVKLQAGKTYQIDHQSMAFDAFLRLEDANGTQLAVDDDSGGNLNARILFPCQADATYRVIATSLGGRTGDFVLTIQQK